MMFLLGFFEPRKCFQFRERVLCKRCGLKKSQLLHYYLAQPPGQHLFFTSQKKDTRRCDQNVAFCSSPLALNDGISHYSTWSSLG